MDPIALGLIKYDLVHVSTHSNNCDIDVAVRHCNFTEALFAVLTCGKLCNLSDLEALDA